MNKNKQDLIGLFVCVGLLVVGIIVSAAMIGGRSLIGLPVGDNRLILASLLFDFVCLFLLFYFAGKIGKQNLEIVPGLGKVQKSRTEQIHARRGLLLVLIGAFLSYGLVLAGIFVSRKTPALPSLPLILGLLLPVVCLAANLLLAKAELRQLQGMKVAEVQEMLLAHREQAETVARDKLRLLRRIRRGSELYALALFLLGLADSWLLGRAGFSIELSIPLIFLCLFYAVAGALRLRFKQPKTVFEDQSVWMDEKEFPRLFALARKAADTMGCRGEVHLALLANDNAGIAQIGKDYSVELGAVLLGVLEEDEMYHVLLHEFAHLVEKQDQAELDYEAWLARGMNPSFLTSLASLLFCWPDSRYELQFELYRYAQSIGDETRADRAMAEYGDAGVAASALIKLQDMTLYDWEEQSVDQAVPGTMEDKIGSLVSGRIRNLRAAIRMRGPFYDSISRKEIQSRSASHPILRSRLESLGVKELRLADCASDPAYRAECDKAAFRTEQELLKINSAEDYAAYVSQRKATVEAWERDGRPLSEQEYPDVVGALKELGRVEDAMELCQRAVQSLGEEAGTDFAFYMLGCYRLHCWDESGIELIYKAIERNSNYIDEGLNQIGSFCCLTGNETALEEYRRRAPEIMQKKKDVFSQLSVLEKGDRLSGEQLPPDLARKILDYIESIDGGMIQRLYLLHKQITEDFSTSAMIVEFTPEASEESRQEIMHKVFLCLDQVSGWQFSLFPYEEAHAVRPQTIPGSLFYEKNR